MGRNPDVKLIRLVEYLITRAGLVLPRKEGVYTFAHRTFQEYLAACYLTERDFPNMVAELARRDPDRWREVALLSGAKAARGSPFAMWALVEELCSREPNEGKPVVEDVWGAHLAGLMLAETADLKSVGRRDISKLERVKRWHVRILKEGLLPTTERVVAGNTLARLGDPRFRSDQWYLPDEPLLGFVKIHEGPFLMGSDKNRDRQAFDDEIPQHEVTLPAYYIAIYPVTVAQFKAFVEDSKYQPQNEDSLKGMDNHPVVYVTWYEALAFTRWLTEKLRDWLGTPELLARLLRGERWSVTLPSEAQWEKAARGEDGRLFPWGNEPDPNMANYVASGIGGTSAVGCFPGGASLYGCQDISGNVWEWTRSLWGKGWDKLGFKYPYNRADGREDLSAPNNELRVLRGGAFYDDGGDVRCALRYGYDPHYGDRNGGFRVVVPHCDSDL